MESWKREIGMMMFDDSYAKMAVEHQSQSLFPFLSMPFQGLLKIDDYMLGWLSFFQEDLRGKHMYMCFLTSNTMWKVS